MKTIDNYSTLAQSDINAYASNPLGETRVIAEDQMLSMEQLIASGKTDKNGKSPTHGTFVRQGDIYIEKIDTFEKKDFKITENRQLALGNTKGSRHMVDANAIVWGRGDNTSTTNNGIGFRTMGPVVEFKERGTISHPEHADVSLPAGIYQVCYQTDGNTMSRVLD